MGRERKVFEKPPIIISRLDDPASASADDRDEHLMLLEAARHLLDVEWTETLAAAESAGDHNVMGYPSTVAYLKERFRMAGGRANRYVKNARSALKHAATFSAWKFRQISGDEAELMFRAADTRQVPRFRECAAGAGRRRLRRDQEDPRLLAKRRRPTGGCPRPGEAGGEKTF